MKARIAHYDTRGADVTAFLRLRLSRLTCLLHLMGSVSKGVVLGLICHELLRFLHLVMPRRARRGACRLATAFQPVPWEFIEHLPPGFGGFVMFGWGHDQGIGPGGGDGRIECADCVVY